MRYTDEEIIRNSEAAEQFGPGLKLPFAPEPNGKFSSDKFGVAPCVIPCRRTLAEVIVLAFDKPNDLAIIPDETPNGKQIGTKIVIHKNWEQFWRRHVEISMQVFKESGFSIGDPENDKFISAGKLREMQAEALQRHKTEYGEGFPL